MSKKLLFKDIVDRVAKKTRYPRYAIKPILRGLFTVIEEAMRDGEEICLYGFGTFYAVDVPEKTVKSNFTDGEDVVVPAHTAYKFRFGKRLANNLDELEDTADER